MNLPPEFLFSQQKLQDYCECPRRFELRYLQRQVWPAEPADAVMAMERWTALGQRFHQMAYQSYTGVPAGRISALASEPELFDWWQHFCQFYPPDLPRERWAECERSVPFGGQRFIAKYDLLACESDQVVIVDWKTSQRKPQRHWMAARWQTRLYPFLLVEGGLPNGFLPRPEQIELLYWFANDPRNSERFRYTEAAYQADRAELLSIFTSLQQASSPLASTSSQKVCSLCAYCTLCEREVQPASWEDWLATEAGLGDDFEFSFDQVPEIAF